MQHQGKLPAAVKLRPRPPGNLGPPNCSGHLAVGPFGAGLTAGLLEGRLPSLRDARTVRRRRPPRCQVVLAEGTAIRFRQFRRKNCDSCKSWKYVTGASVEISGLSAWGFLAQVLGG